MADNKYVTGRSFTISGTAVFPFLNTPDTKFDAGGVYRVGLKRTPALEKQIAEEVEAILEQAGNEIGRPADPSKTNLFRELKDKETKEPTGEGLIEFKMKATRTRKGETIPQRPIVVDALRKPVTEEVYGGSEVNLRVFLQYSETNFGKHLTPKLKAVQVVSLVGPGGESVDDMFDDVEGGFTSAGEQDTTPATSPADAPADPGADDGRDF